MKKKIFFVGILKVTDERTGSGSAFGSAFGSVSQRYGSEDPDPYQNVTDPEHWIKRSATLKMAAIANNKKV